MQESGGRAIYFLWITYVCFYIWKNHCSWMNTNYVSCRRYLIVTWDFCLTTPPRKYYKRKKYRNMAPSSYQWCWRNAFWIFDQDEKSMFRQLLRVNGIGGKTALSLLGLWWETLLKAIQLEDDVLLSSVPGIGKKTAQKIIVDLKWSIDFSKKSSPSQQKNTTDTLLASSLVQMGYDKVRVEQIIAEIGSHLSLEVRTIEAIKRLSK